MSNAVSLEQLQNTPPGQLIHERRGEGFITAVGSRTIVEYRTTSRARPRIRTGAEFNQYVKELLASQPRSVTGYRARLAAIQELVRQTDATRYPGR
jgi:hypothetical protein